MLTFPRAACACEPRGFIEQTCTNVHVFDDIQPYLLSFSNFYLAYDNAEAK